MCALYADHQIALFRSLAILLIFVWDIQFIMIGQYCKASENEQEQSRVKEAI